MQKKSHLRVFENAEVASSAPYSNRSLVRESWERIIVVSNRLPFKVVYDNDRKPSILPSSGGLVTAMRPLLHRGIAGKWIGWPGTEEEEGLEEALRSESVEQFDIGVVMLSAQEEEQYYQGYANQVLAPLLVSEVDKIDLAKARECWPVYQNVQRKFADKICEDLRTGDIVWVHDYHLTGIGRELRTRGVSQPIGFFLHTPFPAKETLPMLVRFRLLNHLLAYDILGFQTRAFERNFIAAVRTHLPDARFYVGLDGAMTITRRGHTTRLGSFPISIDANEFERQLYAWDTQRNIHRLNAVVRARNDTKVIFNAGRMDYSKGFFEELLAYDRLFQKHPSLVGSVTLIQLAIPSRTGIEAYREYKERVTALARDINRRYGKVVHQVHAHMNRARYLAHLNVADVLSVPTLSDGMNLVAKEGAIVGHESAVMILGKNAGAAEELGKHTLLIDPKNTDAFAGALYHALTMSSGERRHRKSALKSIVTGSDVFGWWSDAQEPLFQRVWDEKRSV